MASAFDEEDYTDIDWSEDGPTLLEQFFKAKREASLRTLRMCDEMIAALSKDDVFSHSNFKKLRRRIGPQNLWATYSGLSQATIGNYERNVTHPNRRNRHLILQALESLRGRLAKNYADRHKIPLDVDIDPVEAKTALDDSILNAALTDFSYDIEEQKIRAIPFESDTNKSEIESIEQDKRDLLESLSSASEEIRGSLSSGVNADITRLTKGLEYYGRECHLERPNPRKLFRLGNSIGRASSNEDITFALSDWDKNSLDSFVADHTELMRLHYKEALARAQSVDAILISEDAELPSGDEFRRIAEQIESAKDEDGQRLFDEDISTLVRDIGREIDEHSEAEILTNDQNRKRALRRRRVEAVKNGSILVGRFLIFASFFVIADPMIALTTAGSIASILGVLETTGGSTIRSYYERLREFLPFLPRFPTGKNLQRAKPSNM